MNCWMMFLHTTGSQVARAASAVVIKDLGCGLLDGEGNFVFTDESHAVITPSGKGKLTCSVKDIANPTGQAVHWNFSNTGLLCSTPAGVTEQWNETVSASGNAKLVCHVK